MSSLSLLLGLVASVVVAPIAAALVYVDATRRGLSRSTRRRSTAVVGVLSACGFLVAATVDAPLFRLYLTHVRPRPVVYSPLDAPVFTAGTVLALGLAGSAVSVCLYRVRTAG